MKWILIIFLIISCTDNSEDMLFQSMLPSGESTPSLPIDGGETIYLTPDASGGEVGHGFTCTGLFFLGWFDGNPRFLVGNDGRDREPGTGGIDPQDFKPSVVLLELDYSASGVGLPATNYATKILEIKTENILDSSCQGVIQANDGTYWFCFQGIYNIQPYADGNGDAILIKSFSGLGANGMAYDSVDDTILIYDGTNAIKRYDTDGNLLDANVVAIGVADQIWLDQTDNDILYVGSGSNGSAGSVSKISISGAFATTYQGFAYATSSEGISIVTNPNDGKKYLYYANDAWYHNTYQPTEDHKINSIQKYETIL